MGQLVKSWNRQFIMQATHNHLTIGLVDDLTCCRLSSVVLAPTSDLYPRLARHPVLPKGV